MGEGEVSETAGGLLSLTLSVPGSPPNTKPAAAAATIMTAATTAASTTGVLIRRSDPEPFARVAESPF